MTVQLSSSKKEEVKRLPRSAAHGELVPRKLQAEILRTVAAPSTPSGRATASRYSVCEYLGPLGSGYFRCDSRSRARSRDL